MNKAIIGRMKQPLLVAILTCLLSCSRMMVQPFAIFPQSRLILSQQQPQQLTCRLQSAVYSSSTDHQTSTAASSSTVSSFTLNKPLGMILEEIVEGAPKGVFIKEILPGGSAEAYTEQLLGNPLVRIQQTDVTTMEFEDVMDLLLNSPETVELQVSVKAIASSSVQDANESADSNSSNDSSIDDYPVGTPVTIQVLPSNGSDKPISIQAKVGDNLRKVLLDNNVPVYQGMRQTLGNCGGAGQCTFCAFDLTETKGWAERSDYENKKLAKLSPDARLTCLNNIQGPVTLKKTER